MPRTRNCDVNNRGARLPDVWGEQAKSRWEIFLADHFRGESARQLQGSGTSVEGEVSQVFQLSEIEREAVRMTEPAQDAPLQGKRLRLEELQFDTAFKVCRLAESGGDQIVKEYILGGGDLGGFAESLAQLRIVVALKSGQQLGADTIAEKLRTEIGGVLTKWLAKGEQEALNLLAGGGEHGADQARRWRVVRGER
jgi:hypothetical protein